MCEQYINSLHIEKLGHKIQEIRERALQNITSKLENGVLFDNDLARSKELLNKLLKWFLFEPCTEEKHVIALIKRVLKSESGKILIQHTGKECIINELEQIKSYIDPKFSKQLEELLTIVNNMKTEFVVPPLQCDVPLSYRSGQSDSDCNSYIGTTATVVEGTFRKDHSAEQQTRIETPVDNASTYRIEDCGASEINNFPINIFEWQPLIEADRHVLNSVENSLINPTQPSSLLQSCDFFRNVLLHDFPAEIFLQRPKIVFEFFSLLNCKSTRINEAVLNCLCDLTSDLITRVNHCKDPCLRNLKLQHIGDISCPCTPSSTANKESCNRDLISDSRDKFEQSDHVIGLQRNQITILKYCYLCVLHVFKYLCAKRESCKDSKPKTTMGAVNLSLVLLDKNLELMSLCLENENSEHFSKTSLELFKFVNDVFISYGTALEYFRVECLSSEENIKFRGVYLCLLHHCLDVLQRLTPHSKSITVLPRNLKSSLANSLLDVTFSRLYPTAHNRILNFVENFSLDEDKSPLSKYREVKRICQGMSATVKFLKDHKNLAAIECFQLANDALPSVEFHKDFDFLKFFVDLCVETYSLVSEDLTMVTVIEETVLCLLNHSMDEVKQEMYRLCHKTAVSYIGPKLNDTTGVVGSQVQFLLTSRILVEIACYGLDSENYNVQKYALEILTYILKCKLIVSETIWNKIIQALVPALPIIICQLTKNCILYKSVASLVDPDVAAQSCLPAVSMLKSNIQFLFLEDPSLRDEAFSRICWLLSSQEKARELLPGFNALYDTSLVGIFRSKKMLDLNKMRRTEHFYQPSSLHQVLEVINSCNVEPVIKRSALNQISVMMEDTLLHQIFLDAGGVKLVVNIMKSALTEKDYNDYPDSFVPVVSILKNLCLYHNNVREELSGNEEVLYFILRGLFLFFTEERLKQDAVILLLLLIFKDLIWGSPSRANFSLPKIVVENMNLPFVCNAHWSVSEYTKCSLKDKITSDRWSLCSIQIQWNAEIFGGFDKLMKWDEILYQDHSSAYNFVEFLKLSKYDLKCIKNSSINYCISLFLTDIQNATSHCSVIQALDNLAIYIQLYKQSSQCNESESNESITDHPWEKTFIRFLKVLPSCDDDIVVLKRVIQLLSTLVTYYNFSEGDCWISSLLKDHTNSLLDVLVVDDNTESDMKTIAKELLTLISVCARQEQHYIDYYLPHQSNDRKSWIYVIKIIACNIKDSGKRHFYNLAYLDSLLSCLVQLTASLSWSQCKMGSTLAEPLPQMIVNLCELIEAFHSGKGPTASVSVMGLSITRHVLLVLNHVLAEIKNSKLKNWETCFFDDVDNHNRVLSFIALWASRDVVLRAASLQFFSGLTLSARAAIEIVHQLTTESSCILDLALRVLTDYKESNAVRGNAAELLSNLAMHSVPLEIDKTDGANFALKKSSTMTLLDLVDRYDFYTSLEIIFMELYTLNYPPKKSKYLDKKCPSESDKSWTSSSEDTLNNVVSSTPCLVKNVCNFLYNLVYLNPGEISQKMHDKCLVKLLFRTICNPCMSITNTRELSLYCDIIEMDTAVCSVLLRLATCNSACLGTILHTRDCLNTLISLLNPKAFNTGLPQLLYLRNKLWISVFNLLLTLVEFSGDAENLSVEKSVEVVDILLGTVEDLSRSPFVECICESLSSLGACDLQNAALNFLICLLRVETIKYFTGTGSTQEVSLKSVLDNVKTSRSVVLSDSKTCPKTAKKSLDTRKINVLEEIYFGKVFVKTNEDNCDDVQVSIVENADDGLITGAEICKILLFLYDLSNLKDTNVYSKKKALITKALSSLLCISNEAKTYALEKKLVQFVMKQFRDLYVRLSLESVECLRRASEKKRVSPMLREIDDLVCLMTNFMVENEKVKVEAAALNLPDVIHKLWIWFLLQSGNNMLLNVLKMICTFTNNCDLACQSLPVTNSIAGGVARKSPGASSLLHSIIALINKQMEQISKTHDLKILETSFNILQNACQSLECRILISKSNLFQSTSRLHPAITKRQKPWDNVELLWLDFLQTFTCHPEGQVSLGRYSDVLELVFSLTSSCKLKNKLMALLVLRNISFYQSNKARLLGSADFLNVLSTKLSSGTEEEKNIVVVIMWTLAANCQKAKNILKSIRLDDKLQNILKHHQLIKNRDEVGGFDIEDIERISYVLGMLRDNIEKIR
ncbi:unnamed protein product [Phyllotreta striolata]|uniref:Rotatin N-terminal domain-containing protein n=1 Tax=Phyllotreta striolata TaxID=444603 RepID=A0A9N9TTR1_PHYSR|nr:unnamed protein product [Phyllotreta striolata]